jgi:hypothetical protein
MNRREISKRVATLFGVASAFPIAIEAKADSDPNAPPPPVHNDSEDDIFYAVYMFERGKDDFVVRGVYTLESDAEAHANRLKAKKLPCAGHCKANRAWLQNMFVGERMGDMKDVLERLEARLMIDAHGVRT